MKVLVKIQQIFLVCIALSFLSVQALAKGEPTKTAEETYTVWEKSGFLNFIVDKNVDFDKYKKLIVFPLNYEELIISKKAKRRLSESWNDFAEQDMPGISDNFKKLVEREFKESESFTLTQKGGPGILVAEFRATEVRPKAFRDVSLGTIGDESILEIAVFSYKVALVDSQTRALVAMIDDDLLIAPRANAINSRITHSRAWTRTFEQMLEMFHRDLVLLSKESPLSKSK